jgi:hypothetical protein
MTLTKHGHVCEKKIQLRFLGFWENWGVTVMEFDLK